MFKVIKVKRGFFKDSIIFEALEDETCTADSFMGRKKFWVDKGDRITSWRKKDYWDIGDCIAFHKLLNEWTQDQFNWSWY